MRKLNLRYLYTAVAAAAITAAAITIPAWAAGGGGDSSGQTQTQERSGRPPLPPPPGVAFSYRGQAPSAAQVKESRAKLDKFATCLKDHGVDVLTPGSSGQAPRPPSRSEMRKTTKDCGTPPAPPAGLLPPLDKKHIEVVRKAMGKSGCPPLPLPPARSGK